MYKFPVKCTTGKGDLTCEIKLGDNWKITILVRKRVVEIRRNDASDEVHISGQLTLRNLNGGPDIQSVSEEIFSRFMKEGSAVEDFYFASFNLSVRNIGSIRTSNFSQAQFHLQGNVIVFNITQNRIAECKKCVHTKSLMALSNDMGFMLDPSNYCFADVSFKCDGEFIPAHKNILSTRSSVFAAMFKYSMKESLNNEVGINDVDISVFRIMLAYIYTGKIPDLTISLASDLLFAADKYQLQDLKRVCCDYLKDNLSLENVLKILVLGDRHFESELKYSALKYICDKCKKFSDLEQTEEWKTIMKENTALAMEILMGVVKSKDEK